MSPTNIYAVHC